MNAYETQLDRVRWQFFCSFTMADHSGKPPNADLLKKTYYALIRDLEKSLSYAPKSFLWALRVESGELAGRTHLHALWANFRPEHFNVSTCFTAMAKWEAHGGGMARVRTWERGRNAVSYITKPGNKYEQGKFGYVSCEVTLSPALEKFLRVRAS